jgi:hypothetical protein
VTQGEGLGQLCLCPPVNPNTGSMRVFKKWSFACGQRVEDPGMRASREHGNTPAGYIGGDESLVHDLWIRLASAASEGMVTDKAHHKMIPKPSSFPCRTILKFQVCHHARW